MSFNKKVVLGALRGPFGAARETGGTAGKNVCAISDVIFEWCIIGHIGHLSPNIDHAKPQNGLSVPESREEPGHGSSLAWGATQWSARCSLLEKIRSFRENMFVKMQKSGNWPCLQNELEPSFGSVRRVSPPQSTPEPISEKFVLCHSWDAQHVSGPTGDLMLFPL